MQKIIISFLAAAATTSFALPSVYVKNSNLTKQVKESSVSTLVADTQDPNRVWVLPPNAGQAELQDIAPTTNASLCRGTKALLNGVSDLDEKRAELSLAMVDNEKESKKLSEIVQQRRDELASVEALPEVQDMKRLASAIEKITGEIEDLYEKAGEAETKEERDAIRQEIKELKAEKKEAKQELKELKKEHRKNYAKFNRAQRRLKAAQENLADVNAYLEQILKDIDDATASMLQLYKERAPLVGATASIDYNSGWTNEIKRLSSNYQGLNFSRIPTYNARVHADFIKVTDKETYYQMLPPIAGYNINGHGKLPYGERKKVDDPERHLTAFPEAVVADLYLNLVGACPALDKDFFEKVDFDFKRGGSGVPLYAISTTYEYDAASVFEVKARYNLWSFYEKVVKRSTRGGFFSRRSFIDIIETKFGNDSLSIEIRNDGHIPPEKVEQIRKDIKIELVSRVLNAIARPKFGQTIKTPVHHLPEENGAVVLAKGLGKVCGVNIYCQVGGWILRAGDAIFGTTTAQTRFQKSWNHTATEHWKDTKLVPKQGITTYMR